MTRAPVIALSHGGGPMPILGDPSHKAIVSSLKTRVPEILRLNSPEAPKAIVIVTAHWSESQPTVSNGKNHDLFYDYYGFPAEAYKLQYNAPGSPEIASMITKAMEAEGLTPQADGKRGWDHGVFVPMLLINPAANIPLVQVSVLETESPKSYLAMGRALARLRDSNVAIICSGSASFHNFRLMRSGIISDPAFRARCIAWSKAVTEAIVEEEVQLRQKQVEDWRKWPNAYEMHPEGGAEHFLPLIVAASAGGKGKAKYYTDEFMGLDMYSYYWE
ncbi:hypothetical protein MMC25_004949 [Agyrium rufum]|nr:hypothetical protein [Agyrium rufum]